MATKLTLRWADLEEAGTLAELNQQLLEDENSRFQPGLGVLANRLADWISGLEWSVEIFENERGERVGYLVYGRRFNQAAPGGDEMYIRQFVVERAHRRHGHGRAAIALFVRTRCRPGMRVMLDVLESNPAGRAFWSEIGFSPYATIMELTAPHAAEATPGDTPSDK